ncbi:aec77 [Escherichia coli]|nr:aec77 [Escherichia coli]
MPPFAALNGIRCSTAHITAKDNAWLYSLSHQTSDVGESEWIHFTGSGYLLRTDAWSYPVLRLKRLGLSRTFRRLVVTLTRRYGVSLIHLDAGAECLPGLPTFDW